MTTRNAACDSTERLLAQVGKSIPSLTALRHLDALLALLNTTRRELGILLDPLIKGNVIGWAFEKGKSPRAAEVRRLVLRDVRRRIRGLPVNAEVAR